uniref:Putative LOV domain-containing protein n=1 Tax=Pellia neesiana TaxID=70144 RepID=A0A126WYD2_PELNE|nr:putative LOV domain-containing protein [Pellia neesiana]
MGLRFIFQEEETGASGGKMDSLVDSLRNACSDSLKDSLVDSLRNIYSDSLKDSLSEFEFNFVISDPRLPENPIVFASEGFCKMSGYTADEVLGRNCRFLQGPNTDRRTVLELRDAIREERSAQVRILNYSKNGEPFWNLFHLAPVFSKLDGTVIHFVGIQNPAPSQLATSLSVKGSILSQLTMDSTRSRNHALRVGEFPFFSKNVEYDRRFLESGCRAKTTPRVWNSFLYTKSCNNLLDSLDAHMQEHRNEAEASSTFLVGAGVGDSDPCKPQGPRSLEATDVARSLVSQLVESSKGKGGVVENRDEQLSRCNPEGAVSSSLMLSLTRIQQSFVLADPHLPDAPIVHTSDLFLHLTGYSREEVVGNNCRFLQGPGTDPESVLQIRESIRLEKPCSIRILNYRKDKRPFWNLLYIAPVRSSSGKVRIDLCSFFNIWRTHTCFKIIGKALFT